MHRSHLCFLQQICEDGEPVGRERFQLQGDDGQGQRGALELPELVAGHTVLHLPGPQRHLEARGPLLRSPPGGGHVGVRGRDARAEPDGRNEVRVAGDEQGVELEPREEERRKRDQNVTIVMSVSSHHHISSQLLPHILYPSIRGVLITFILSFQLQPPLV